MDYRDRHVVVTGGTGALGTAVVGALLKAGAVCHVPYRSESEAKRFPHADNKMVSLAALRDLADEAAVTDFYGGFDQLWASIHDNAAESYTAPANDFAVARNAHGIAEVDFVAPHIGQTFQY
jgi:NAD(P)-dependent dehydrogenase (short-subunit alcohol dehydrogenase family)